MKAIHLTYENGNAGYLTDNGELEGIEEAKVVDETEVQGVFQYLETWGLVKVEIHDVTPCEVCGATMLEEYEKYMCEDCVEEYHS